MGPLAKEHIVTRFDISPSCQDALLDTRDFDADGLKQHLIESLSYDYVYVPDINGLYPYTIQHIDNVVLTALCKVRSYSKAKEVAGWYVALVTLDEFDQLETAPIEGRDKLLMDLLDIQDAKARGLWSAHYGNGEA